MLARYNAVAVAVSLRIWREGHFGLQSVILYVRLCPLYR